MSRRTRALTALGWTVVGAIAALAACALGFLAELALTPPT